MQTENEIFTLNENGWTVRIKRAKVSGASKSILLLHGLTGNEDVMWIFAKDIPPDYTIFTPRAPVSMGGNAYSWLPLDDRWPALEGYFPAAEQLMTAFKTWAQKTGAPQDPVDVMGFSQGAAMAFALSARFPQQVGRVMALAGFLPGSEAGSEGYQAFRGKQIFIAHGSKDETVPVRMAHASRDTLSAAGADVVYCESDVGHKMSAECLRGLDSFLNARNENQ